MEGNLTPLQRFFLAFVAFWYVLVNARVAAEFERLRARERGALPPAGPQPAGGEPGPTTTSPVPTPRAVVPGQAPETPAPGVAAVTAGTPDVLAERPVITTPRQPAPAAAAGAPAASAPVPATAPAASAPVLAPHAGALHVLALLQRDGRLVDFVSERLDGFSDAEIGAAARTVHSGCRKVVEEYLTLEPIFTEPEEARVTVAAGFDPASVRLTGNVVGAPPFQGTLRHHGWRVKTVKLPPLPPHDPRILAPAEIEL